jgi:hypothetical protein
MRRSSVVLQKVTPVVHGFSGHDLETNAVRQLEDLSENLLEFFAGEQVAQLPPSHRNEEKDVPHDDGELLKQGAEVVEIGGVVAADGGVHLDGNAGLVGPLDGLDGARPGSRQPAEDIVNFGA